MKNYLKLVDFELKRFWKVYAALLSLIVVVESVTLILNAYGLKRSVEKAERKGSIPEQLPLEILTDSILFMSPIVICLAVLLIYMFFTWYREWFAKNTFAFQVLMLPFKRMSVFYAKLTSLLLFIFGCIAVQLAMYPVLNALYKAIVPEAGRVDGTLISWISGSEILQVLIPVMFEDFVLLYGIGITSVLVIFTIILIERSFRIKGIVLGVVYGIFSFMLLVLPSILQDFLSLYQNELLMAISVSVVILVVLSLFISTYLMNKRIWV
ncbi:hypothetical protein [Bacillus sp. JJ722]|uniref:hypothetical protein n=1 Tax=Bacillus sp. JJ722 TaxID=3122973 RepID=UPI002FFF0B50